MEKSMNIGSFEALDHEQMMEVEGGYRFLDDYAPTQSSVSFWDKRGPSGATMRDAFDAFSQGVCERERILGLVN